MHLERKKVGCKGACWWAAALLIGSWLLAAGYLIGLPEEVFTTNLIVDDSLYFTVPARNFWLGRGLSFDGLELTNGVQTLWMLVTLGLAGVISDPMLLLRSLVATSALCWLLAGLGLYGILRQRSRAGAVFAANGFLWAGVHGRVAFMGMENGATALVAVLVLAVGARVVKNGWTARGCLALGAAIALCALNRTEGVLLGPMVAVPLLLGWLGGEQSLATRFKNVGLLAVPGVLLIGSVLIVHRISFDLWLPISGTVKSYYEHQWLDRPEHGGFVANIAWHVRFVVLLALAPLREDLSSVLASVSWTRVKLWHNLVWAVLALVVLRGLWGWWRARRSSAVRLPRFGPVFACFAIVHVVLMGVMLPHFTSYGTWYFAGEMVAIWCGLGVAFATLQGRWVALPLVLAGLTTVAGLCSVTNVSRDATTGQLRGGGIWLEKHVPPGTLVGTLSSGLAAWYAPSLHVVNLDGLINNRRYFEDYLSKDRVAEYFQDRGIEWFADYSTVKGWRNGFSWRGRIPAIRLVPRVYARMSGERAYAVWQVLPREASFELLQDYPGIKQDRYVELAVAADVHGRFPVVPAEQLAATLAAQPELVVARSLAQDPDLSLLHVMTTREQLQEVALRKATVWPERLLEASVGPAVRLLGWDETQVEVRGERRIAVTLYWQALAVAEDAHCSLVVMDSEGSRSIPVGTCHGTLPMSQWQPQQVVTETVVVADFDPDEDELAIFAGNPKLPVCKLRFGR